MSKYTVEISYEAQTDLISIRDYIRDRLKNPSAAKKLLDDTYNAVISLEDYPYDHEARPNKGRFSSIEKRQYNYRKNYCLIYVIKEEQKLVRIIQIAYTGQDLDHQSGIVLK